MQTPSNTLDVIKKFAKKIQVKVVVNVMLLDKNDVRVVCAYIYSGFKIFDPFIDIISSLR